MRKKLVFALLVVSSTCFSTCISPQMSGDPFLYSGDYEYAGHFEPANSPPQSSGWKASKSPPQRAAAGDSAGLAQ